MQCHRNILELRSTAHLCTLSALDRVSETYTRTQLAGQEMRAREGRGGGWDGARLENSSPAALGHQCHCQSRELGSTAYLRTGKVPNRVRDLSARFGTDFGQSPPFCSGVAGFDCCDGGARRSLGAYGRTAAGLVFLSLLVGLW